MWDAPLQYGRAAVSLQRAHGGLISSFTRSLASAGDAEATASKGGRCEPFPARVVEEMRRELARAGAESQKRSAWGAEALQREEHPHRALKLAINVLHLYCDAMAACGLTLEALARQAACLAREGLKVERQGGGAGQRRGGGRGGGQAPRALAAAPQAALPPRKLQGRLDLQAALGQQQRQRQRHHQLCQRQMHLH